MYISYTIVCNHGYYSRHVLLDDVTNAYLQARTSFWLVPGTFDHNGDSILRWN